MLKDNTQEINENLHRPASRTLRDTIETIKAMPQLSRRQRIELQSAINSFAKVVGRAPELIEEDLIVIREAMRKAHPGRVGMGRSTWRNVKSKVMRCLRLCGIEMMSGRCKTPITPAWSVLRAHIPSMHWTRITRLVRWCCERGIEPGAFDETKSETFRKDIERLCTKHAHHKIYLQNVNGWEACREQFPALWPQNEISAHHKVDRYSYPAASFSQAFNADVDAMITDAVKPRLGRRSGRKVIKASTADQRRRTVYRIASIIARQRTADPGTFQSIADIISPEDVDRALDFIVARVRKEKTGDLYRVARTMHLLAARWVGASKGNLEELASIRTAVRPKGGPAKKTIELLEMFRDPRLQQDFLLLPEMVMAKIKRKNSPTRADAINAQLAVMSAVLVGAPLRSANAVTLCEGVNLLRFGSGKTQQVRITIPGEEVKNAKPLDFLLRPAVVDLIDVFDKRFRALITKDKRGYLCPGRRGHKRAAVLSTQLAAFTSRELGVRMTAHQWRHVVGYIYLLRNPGNYEPIRRMLGHSSIDVTQEYYAFMLDEDAQEAIDSAFEEIRQEGRLRYRRPTKRRSCGHA